MSAICYQVASIGELGEIAVAPAAWYAVQTRSRFEKSVMAQLLGRGITAYVPMSSEMHRWSDRAKQVDVPLFAGYVFIHLHASSSNKLAVLQSRGVVRFVMRGLDLARIPDEQIEQLQRALTDRVDVKPGAYLTTGQRVRVEGGSLDGLEGIVLAQKSETTLVIQVDAIQRSIYINLGGYQVVPI